MHLRRQSRVKAEPQAQLTEYERRYGGPSERLADAFRDVFHKDGEVRQTEDFLAWGRPCTRRSKHRQASREASGADGYGRCSARQADEGDDERRPSDPDPAPALACCHAGRLGSKGAPRTTSCNAYRLCVVCYW